MTEDDFAFEAEAPTRQDKALILDLEGYEGPLDVLLSLARDQKVDLTQISILKLADQYLAFVQEAQDLQLELAADYLVMAAWLAYLKSRLLLPQTESEDEPSGAEMAAALAFQLRRLESMRDVGQKLFARPQLGQDLFQRGAPEPVSVRVNPVYELSLYDILEAYARQSGRGQKAPLTIAALDLYSVEEAIKRLESLLGRVPDWQTLSTFLPDQLKPGLGARSAVAATFAASLELVREGRVQLKQDETFGPIYVRGKQETQ